MTHLVNDGFSKPSLIYWLSVFALRAPFSLYEECLRASVRACVCVLRGVAATSSLIHNTQVGLAERPEIQISVVKYIIDEGAG